MPCRRLASKAQQKQWRLFRGWGERGEENTPFCEKTQDSKKLESIRENTTLRNLESTESNAEILKDAQLTESKEILKNEKTQNLGGAESKFSLDSVDCLESSSVYRKCASPRGVPDAIAPRDSINLLKNAVYARAAEAMGLCPHCR